MQHCRFYQVLHQVGVSFDLYYDARKHKIKIKICVFVVTNFIGVYFKGILVSALRSW